MKSGRARAKCLTLPAEDFPDVVYRGETHSFTLPAVDLTTMFDKVGFAISDEETRYYLNGIFVHASEDALTAVATDGHRLSKIDLEQPEGAKMMPGVIVPKRTTALFGLLAGKEDNPVALELSDAFVRFTTPRLSITSKLIDGTFPDYNSVIPRGNEHKATIPLAALTEAVERLAVFAQNKDRTMKWEFTPGNLAVSSRSEIGEASDELEISCEFEMTIGFNAAYLLDILKTFRGPDVLCSLDAPSSPMMIADLGDSRRELVLMPQRV